MLCSLGMLAIEFGSRTRQLSTVSQNCILCLFSGESLTKLPRLVLNSLCSPGGPWTCLCLLSGWDTSLPCWPGVKAEQESAVSAAWGVVSSAITEPTAAEGWSSLSTVPVPLPSTGPEPPLSPVIPLSPSGAVDISLVSAFTCGHPECPLASLSGLHTL